MSNNKWMVGTVHRGNAGLPLYNAVEVATGREHPQTPTHSRALAQEFVDELNATEPVGAVVAAARVVSACESLASIALRMKQEAEAIATIINKDPAQATRFAAARDINEQVLALHRKLCEL